MIARVRTLWQMWWPVDFLAAVVFVLVLIFASYLNHRQDVAAQHNEQVRKALCALIDRVPAGKDAGIDQARFLARCGKPQPPTVFLGKPHPTRTVIVTPSPQPPVFVLAPAATAPPSHSPTPSPSPSRSPRPRPSRSPTPSPSRSPLCLPILCR